MHPDHHEIFDEIGRLNRSPNTPRDQQIAARLTQLYHVGHAEEEEMSLAAVRACVEFFLTYPAFPLPRITLFDGTIHARWLTPSRELCMHCVFGLPEEPTHG